MKTVTTADGSTIRVTPAGVGYDLWIRDAVGRTVATVYTTGDRLRLLLSGLKGDS